MKCPNCQAQVTPESVYCHRCGERLSDQADTPRQTLLSRVAGDSTAAAPGADANPVDEDRVIWRGSYSAKDMVSSWLIAAALTILLPLLLSFIAGDPSVWWILACVLLLIWLGLLAVLICASWESATN